MATPKHRARSAVSWLDQTVGLLTAIAVALLPDRITRRGAL